MLRKEKSQEHKFDFLGFSLNLNPHLYQLGILKGVQDKLLGKVYSKAELDHLQEILTKGEFGLNVRKDFIFVKYPRPDNEKVKLGVRSGSFVNEVLPFENDYEKLTVTQLNEALEELKQHGVIVGNCSIAENINRECWSKVQKNYSRRHIYIQHQYGWSNVYIYQRNELISWRFAESEPVS